MTTNRAGETIHGHLSHITESARERDETPDFVAFSGAYRLAFVRVPPPEHLAVERPPAPLMRRAQGCRVALLVSVSLLSGFSTLALGTGRPGWLPRYLRPKAPASPGGRVPRTDVAPSAPERALEHYNRGREHYLNGRYRDALQELEIAVNLDPTSPDLRLQRGTCVRAAG